MTNRIRPPEWEALSAYLDNQISAKDRARLEARLRQDPEMAQALEELRRTRIILRSQPRLRAPRNFSLTPAMAGVRKQGWKPQGSQFATMRLASLLAAVFLIVVTVGDLAVRRFSPEPTTMIGSEQTFEPNLGKGSGGGGGGAGVAPQPAMEMEVAPAAAAETEAEASEVPDQMVLAVTPMGYPLLTEEALSQMAEPGFDARNSEEPSPEEALAKGSQTAPTPPATVLIRILQAALALVAIGAGIVAWMMRRTNV